ncbi:MAG: hypothetical protein KJ970_11335 [Candidatus Eisenbacteria bacterium]|uniref:Penicillin-binding protein activator LpoB n=1 Tax=Eiseniibacteriota bacterium TaxID=2212470 RepID=A0A948W6U9_UNCEI|nr:hypothetical protein [Candidatus Eisenbacteria bacterium]MBU2691510.1 hypothetical protein [Candidatus Eisenbacteria bacterium]
MNRWVMPAIARLLLLLVAGTLSGCASSGESFIHPNMDFGHVQRCAILPFQNLCSDDLADERLQSIFLMEVLKKERLEIIDPGETLSGMLVQRLSPGKELTPQQGVALGKELGVDAIFFGVVEEYGINTADRKRGPEITLVLGMMETETGTTIWRSQVHKTGMSIWNRLFGGSPASLYDVSRNAVRQALKSLF